MSTDGPIADSSPAPASPLPPLDLGTLSAEERTEWRLTGKTPAPAEVEASSPAASTPAEPAVQAASTDATSSPASEPGTPEKPKTAERIQQLLTERLAERQAREAAERERDELRARLHGAKPDAPASSPAAPGETFPAFDAWLQTHPEGQYEDYITARVEHAYTVKQNIAAREAAQQRLDAERQTRLGAFLTRFDAAVSATPTLRDTLNPSILALKPIDALSEGERVTPLNVVAQEIIESEHAVALLAHLSAHPDELDTLAGLSPQAVIRHMARLESTVSAPPAVPPVKTVSSAPRPPTTLGSKPATPADPVHAAIANDDVAAYMREMNARALAGTR